MSGKYMIRQSPPETWSTSRVKIFVSFLSAKACSIMASSGSPCGAHLRNWGVCGWPWGGLTESNWSFMCLILDWHCQFVFNLIHVDNKRACHSFSQACTHCFSYSSSFLQKLIVSFLASYIVSFLPIGSFVQFRQPASVFWCLQKLCLRFGSPLVRIVVSLTLLWLNA